MKNFPSIGVLEFNDIPKAILATDAMLKDSPVATLKTGIISPARYLTIVSGTPASVEHSLDEGRFVAAEALMEWLFLPDVHPELYEAIIGRLRPRLAPPAILTMTVQTCCSCILATERCLKGTPISLFALRLADPALQGRAVSVLAGTLPDIVAAREIAALNLEQRHAAFSLQVISAPHDSLIRSLAGTTDFHAAPETEVPEPDQGALPEVQPRRR